jgi:ABC-type multidrug transport system ATPase subunit
VSRSLLVASHLLHEIESLEAGLAVILGGRLVASGTAAEIRGFVDALPSELRVRCDAPRRLAELACRENAVESMRFEGDDVLIMVTRQPLAVANLIAAAVAGQAVTVRELAPSDHSLEGIFGRLMRMHRGVGP